MTDLERAALECDKHIAKYPSDDYRDVVCAGAILRVRDAIRALPAQAGGEWVSVPREPTEAMYAAANREWDGRMSARSAGVWQAMIAASEQSMAAGRELPAVNSASLKVNEERDYRSDERSSNAGDESAGRSFATSNSPISDSAQQPAPAASPTHGVADWEDSRVQIVYDLLCDDKTPPNPQEHWEGWLARRIVGALFAEHPAEVVEGQDTRPCTCHPDDNPPVPCPRKYALSECRAAAVPQSWMPEEIAVLVNALNAADARRQESTAQQRPFTILGEAADVIYRLQSDLANYTDIDVVICEAQHELGARDGESLLDTAFRVKSDLAYAVSRNAEEIAADRAMTKALAEAPLEAARKDGERYRQVRATALNGDYADLRAIINSDSESAFDAKVDILKDAARAKESRDA